MGIDKALLYWNSVGYIFLEKIINEYFNAGIDDIIVVIQEPLLNQLTIKYPNLLFKATYCINHEPELGRLNSIRIGLNAVKPNQHVIIQNIDNPFINNDFLNALLSINPDNGFIQPVYDKKNCHPVLISSTIRESVIQKCSGYSDLKSILNDYPKIIYRHNFPLLSANINTVEDYQDMLKFMG
jgi:CTP:molybdopterin cytidylyltransferase MocA